MPEPLDFSQRAELKEEMDAPCSYEELRRCLRHLAIVNRLTWAHQHTLRWLERIPQLTTERRPFRLLDIGCGYGDMLRLIERWAKKRNAHLELVGADINPNCLRAAREATPASSCIQWVLGDPRTTAKTQRADLVVSCGVFHHLSEQDIISMLEWMEGVAILGWYITDLHRQPRPYQVFSALMRGPWWQRFIRTDGLRSIRRSFRREDWQRMCTKAGIAVAEISIEECRPARLCVGRVKRAPVERLAARDAAGVEPAASPVNCEQGR